VAQIFPENDKLEISVGETLGGKELVIVPTKTGLYRVEHRGAGAPPGFTDQVFTSLLLARRAVENYRRSIAAQLAVKSVKEKVISAPTHKEQRRQAALETKNGELEVPETDEE
jgi:hypothetical protein